MLLFLIPYVLLYGLLHLYVWRWVGPTLRGCRWSGRAFVGFVIAMAALPILLRMTEHYDGFLAARLIGWVGYSWLVAVLLLIATGLFADAWNFVVWVLGRIMPAASSYRFRPRAVVTVSAGLFVLFAGWGSWEVRDIRLRTITIETPRLPADAAPLRIAQIVDLHLGLSVGRGQLDRVVRLVEEARPDVLLCAGDLFDSQSGEMETLADRLGRLKFPLGKYAVLGNHEYFIGLKRSLHLLERAGFKTLRQEMAAVRGGTTEVRIAGVDDTTDRPYTILLKHQPVVSAQALGGFDLQLSGHTHAGQIFPFHAVVRLMYRHFTGAYDLADGSRLYVSPGAGVWGPPIRVLARPEVTLFVIRPAPRPRMES